MMENVRSKIGNPEFDQNMLENKLKKLKNISKRLFPVAVNLRKSELSEMEKHDQDGHVDYCDICMEFIESSVYCDQCHQKVCTVCFSKINKCPFCRNPVDTPQPVVTPQQDILQPFVEEINSIRARLEVEARVRSTIRLIFRSLELICQSGNHDIINQSQICRIMTRLTELTANDDFSLLEDNQEFKQIVRDVMRYESLFLSNTRQRLLTRNHFFRGLSNRIQQRSALYDSNHTRYRCSGCNAVFGTRDGCLHHARTAHPVL